MRDSVKLDSIVYTPGNETAPGPCIFTLTPYIARSYHDCGTVTLSYDRAHPSALFVPMGRKI
jgi:predicted acyl esterase